MANVVADPKVHPEAIIPDFSKPDPLLTFKKEDVAFTYGSKWKQRYFTKIGDDYYVFPAQWDVLGKVWRAYYAKAGTDWWTLLATLPAEATAFADKSISAGTEYEYRVSKSAPDYTGHGFISAGMNSAKRRHEQR